MENKKKQPVEGFIVTLLGLLAIAASMTIGDNPVKMKGWIGFVAQARFLPLLVGVVITILGVQLIFEIKKSNTPQTFEYPISRDEIIRLVILIVIFTLYCFAISKIGFLIPTIVYFLVVLFYLNIKTYKPITIVGIAAVYFIVAYYLVPMMLKINMP